MSEPSAWADCDHLMVSHSPYSALLTNDLREPMRPAKEEDYSQSKDSKASGFATAFTSTLPQGIAPERIQRESVMSKTGFLKLECRRRHYLFMMASISSVMFTLWPTTRPPVSSVLLQLTP